MLYNVSSNKIKIIKEEIMIKNVAYKLKWDRIHMRNNN